MRTRHLLVVSMLFVALGEMTELTMRGVGGRPDTRHGQLPDTSVGDEPAERLNFRTYTPGDGLPAAETVDIEGDREGFVWFASGGGLAKFDGRTFTRFPTDPFDATAMPQFAVSDLTADPNGGMWAAAGVLVHLDSLTDAVTQTDVDAEIIDAADSVLWIWTPGEVKRFDTVAGTVLTTLEISVRGADDEPVELVALSDNRAVIAGEGGVWLLDAFGNATSIEVPGEPHPILALTERAAGGAWLVGHRALYRLDPTADTAVAVQDLPPTESGQPFVASTTGLLEREDSSVWISRDRQGIDVFDPEGEARRLPPRTAPGDAGGLATSDFHEDGQGGLWLSVQGLGVQYLAPGVPAVWASAPPRSSTEPGFSPFLDLERIGDTLWVASDGRGLYRYGTASGVWSAPLRASAEGLPSDRVTGLAVAGDALWLGTWGAGIARIDLESLGVTRLPEASVAGPNILDIVEGPNDTMWASIDGRGVQVFDHDTEPLLFIGPGGDIETDGTQYLSIAFEDDDTVWLGGSAGIERVDLVRGGVTGRWHNDSGHLLGDVVFDLVLEGDGTVWAGTSAGLEHLSPDSGVTRHFGSVEGVPGPMVLQVEPQTGRDVLWVGTSMALVEFDLSTERVIQAFTEREGVPIGGVSRLGHARLADGIDVFSTTWGLAFARMVPPPSYSPPVYLTSVGADGRHHAVGRDTTLRLPSWTNQVDFTFAAVDFQHPDGLTYDYRLVGVSNTWQGGNIKTSVAYSNLPPGNYRFEVRARSSSGRYSDVASVAVIVEPAWWQTRVARFGSGAAMIASLGLALLTWARSGRRRQRQLEWLVARRTAALSEQTERARAANEAKTRFLSNISHELRNPLHSVLGFAELISRPESAVERHRHWAECIHASGSDLLGMIEELLELSSLQSSPPRLQVGVMGLRSTLVSASEAAALMPGASGKEFCVNVDVADDAVLCDARRLRQVLVNLLANAVRHSEGNLIGLSVRQHPMTVAGVGRYRFAVVDEGPGMAADEAARIFEPFVRGTGAKGSGAGLGLSICQQLVGRLGGELMLDTDAGAPSEFWFELALAIDSTIDLRDAPGAGTRFERAMIVDDDAGVRQSVADGLSLLGLRSVVAATAEEAVGIVASYRPDILFVDHGMPGADGADAAAAIRAELAAPEGDEAMPGPKLFVVAVTGSLDQAGAQPRGSYDHYLEKPVRLTELAALLGRTGDGPMVQQPPPAR